MNLQSSKLYPELDLLPAGPARKDLLRRVRNRLLRSRAFWLYALVSAAVHATIIVLAFHFAMPALRPYVAPLIATVVLSFLLGAGGGVGYQYLWRAPIQAAVREQLVAQGIPVCVKCGYDLRGQTEPRCPECGAAFEGALLGERGEMGE